MSIDKVSNIIQNVKWKLDADISSIQYSETGIYIVKWKDAEDILEIPEDLDSIHLLDGVFLAPTEEKLILMCLALEYLNMGKNLFSVINNLPVGIKSPKKIIMLGDLFFANAASKAAKSKDKDFYKIFSSQCVRLAQSMNAIDDRIEDNSEFFGSSIIL